MKQDYLVIVKRGGKTRFGRCVEAWEGSVLIEFRWLCFVWHTWMNECYIKPFLAHKVLTKAQD